MGSLEAEVLSYLWSRPDGATPVEIHEALHLPVVYTTITTIVVRLWKKGLLTRTPVGRAFTYRPLVSEAALTAERMQTALRKATDADGALAHFVGSLSAEELQVLRRRLAEMDGDVSR